MGIDPLRHLSVFKPNAFGNRRIDVVGCGATGSPIVMLLAKLGVENIHVWDFDRVEDHNIANQIYGLSDVGDLKVEALARRVKADTGTSITVYPEKVESQPLGEVVFLLTDTMKSRKEIWDGTLKYKLRTKLCIETRMGADSGRIYTVNPNKREHVHAWEEAWYPDEEAEVSSCGSSISVGPTAHIVAGLAVWQMIRWFSIEQGSDDVLDHEIIFGLRSMNTITRTL